MTDPLGIGVVGVGVISQRAILPHLTQHDMADKVRVTAVCDPVPGRAEETAERFGVPSAYLSIEEMLGDAAVEAVTIASPIGLHYNHARLAIEEGRHVHSNKTLATTTKEADDLIALAANQDIRLVASPGEVLRPQVTRARELIAEGEIGRLVWGICGVSLGTYHEEESERDDAPGGTPINPSWYFKRPGGGPLYDGGVYALHQLTSVLGPARRVTAMSGTVVPVRTFMGEDIPTEMDDNTVMILEFGEGAFVLVYATAAGDLGGDFGAGTYFGTDGVINGLNLNGEPYDFPGREETLSAPTTDWEVQMRVLPHVVGPHREIPEAHVFEDIMQMVRWVRDGVPSAATAEHARHVIEIIEAAYRAAESGETQDLESTFEFPPAAGT